MSEHANLVFAAGITVIALAGAIGTVLYWLFRGFLSAWKYVIARV